MAEGKNRFQVNMFFDTPIILLYGNFWTDFLS